MKKEFLVMLWCIFAMLLCSAQTSESGEVSLTEKMKKDTLIGIDEVSGWSDTMLTTINEFDILKQFDDVLKENGCKAKKPNGDYVIKRIGRKWKTGNEIEDWFYSQNQLVGKVNERVCNEKVTCDKRLCVDLCGDTLGNSVLLIVYNDAERHYKKLSVFYMKNELIEYVEYSSNFKFNKTEYTPKDCDLEKLFNSKVDSLRKAYPQVDWDRLMEE